MTNKRSIDRRTFLKGLGAATGLAATFMGSKVALGNTETAPTRVILVALQHGWGRDFDFDNKITGSEFDFQLPPHLRGFDSIKDQMVFVDGVRGTLWGNAHDVSYSDIFTAAVPWDETGSAQLGQHFPEPTGPSLDWLLGQHSGKPVLRVSARYRSWGRQSQPLCFDGQSRVLDPYFRARDAYDAIIDPIRAGAQMPDPGKDAVRENLFEYLGRDTDRLMKKVQGAERAKLERYLTSLNDLWVRVKSQGSVQLSESDIPDRPTQSPEFEAMIDHYLEMIRLSFWVDSHRVAVLGLGEGVDAWSWRDKNGNVQMGNPWGTNFHHEVAHHSLQNNPDRDPRLAFEGWVGWYVRKIVDLTNLLKNTPDVDGKTLLDNTIIMLTGEVGTGNHDRRNKLHMLIGGGDRLRRGRWINVPTVPARNRNGVFIGGETRDGQEVESGLNYGNDLSVLHTADVLKAVGNLAGLSLTSIGLPSNNRAPMDLDLT